MGPRLYLVNWFKAFSLWDNGVITRKRAVKPCPNHDDVGTIRCKYRTPTSA